jgi:hypothetical protein
MGTPLSLLCSKSIQLDCHLELDAKTAPRPQVLSGFYYKLLQFAPLNSLLIFQQALIPQ